MAVTGKINRYDLGDGVIIYGRASRLDDFITLLVASGTTAETGASKNVKKHRVTRYPGDPGFDREAHDASFLKGYPQKRIALPGKRAWAYRDGNILGIIDLTSAVQFTYQGTFKKLVDKLNTRVGALSYWVKSPTGRPVRINLPILP